MTAIVGVIDGKGDAWLGADGLTTTGYVGLRPKQPKVFVKGGVGFAHSGWPRFAQIVRFHATIPPLPTRSADVWGWAVTKLVPCLRKALEGQGFTKVEHGVENINSSALIAVRGRLFILWSNWDVQEYKEKFVAHGCGWEFCLGALSVLPKKLAPKERLKKALAASAKWCNSVGPPYTILRIPK